MALSIFTVLYNHHLYLTPKYFHRPPEVNPLPSSSHSPALSPQARVTTCLPSISMDLPVLHILSKWNHATRGLVCLASFVEHDVSRVIRVLARGRPSLCFMSEWYSIVRMDLILFVYFYLFEPPQFLLTLQRRTPRGERWGSGCSVVRILHNT